MAKQHYYSKTDADEIEAYFMKFNKKFMKYSESEKSNVLTVDSKKTLHIIKNNAQFEVGYIVMIVFENGKRINPSLFCYLNRYPIIYANRELVNANTL